MRGIGILILLMAAAVSVSLRSKRVQSFIFGREINRGSWGSESVYFWGLHAIAILGFLLRLYTTWQWNTYRPDVLIADEPGYNNLARDLLSGYGFTWPGRVPLYPVWLALIYFFTDGSYNAVRWAQVVPGVMVIYLVYALTHRVLGPRAGLLAAFFSSISYILIHQSVRLLSESIYTPVILLAAIALWDAVQKPAVWRFAWVGVVLGVSNLIRPSLFLFPFFAALGLALLLGTKKSIKYSSVLILSSFMVVTPWMVRNYLHYQAIYPLATSNAILWQGSPEYYHLIRTEGYTYLDVWEKVIYGPDSKQYDPGTVEGDRWWSQRAIRSILDEPFIYLIFFVEKLGTYWIGDPNADWADTYIFNYQALKSFGFSNTVAVQYMIARFLPVTGLAAVILLRKKLRLLAPVYMFLIYNTLLHAATHAEARLSEPLQPFLLVLVAGGTFEMIAYFRARPKAKTIDISLEETSN